MARVGLYRVLKGLGPSNHEGRAFHKHHFEHARTGNYSKEDP